MAQQGPIAGVVKPGGGMNRWERSLLPSGKLSRLGKLVKALEHHTMHHTIARRAVHHARKEADKEVYKNIDPKSSELYRLQKKMELFLCKMCFKFNIVLTNNVVSLE